MVLPLSTSLLYMLSTELRVSKTDQIPKSEKHRLVAWYMTCYSDIFQVNSAVKLNLFSLVLLVSRCTLVANQITEQPGRWPFALRAVERRGSKNWMGQLRPQISWCQPSNHPNTSKYRVSMSHSNWINWPVLVDPKLQKPTWPICSAAFKVLSTTGSHDPVAHSKQSWKVRSQAKYSFGCVLSAYRESHGVFWSCEHVALACWCSIRTMFIKIYLSCHYVLCESFAFEFVSFFV